MNILLVDDDPEIRLLVRVALERVGGHRVRAVATGAEALVEAARLAPDVVLLDLVLEAETGEEVLRALRREPALRDVPVILLTAKSASDALERLHGLDVKGVLTKPFDPLALADDVGRLVGGGGPSD